MSFTVNFISIIFFLYVKSNFIQINIYIITRNPFVAIATRLVYIHAGSIMYKMESIWRMCTWYALSDLCCIILYYGRLYQNKYECPLHLCDMKIGWKGSQTISENELKTKQLNNICQSIEKIWIQESIMFW